MAVLTEDEHKGGYLVSESNGTRSRGTGTVLSGQELVAGELVGIETVSGKYVAYDPAGTIVGSDTVAGVSYGNIDATASDIPNCVLSVRDAEVNGSELTYNEAVADVTTAEVAGLKALGIIVR